MMSRFREMLREKKAQHSRLEENDGSDMQQCLSDWNIGTPLGEPGEIARGKQVPLLAATAEYTLTFDQKNLPMGQITRVNVEHTNEEMISKFDQKGIKEKLSKIDQQTLFEQIKGFFDKVYTAVKETVFKKQDKPLKNAKQALRDGTLSDVELTATSLKA